MKKLGILSFLFALTLGLCACGTLTQPESEAVKVPSTAASTQASSVVSSTISSAQQTEADPYASKNITLQEAAGRCKLYGRLGTVGTGISCDWAAAGIEFRADCRGDVAVEMSCEGSAYFTIFVDGVRSEERPLVSAGKTTVKLAEGLSAGEHTFKLLRQTEVAAAIIILESIRLDGTLLAPPADSGMYIEFIGDSISAGYGNLGNPQFSGPTTYLEYSDGTQTYAALTAEKLKADFSVVAISGSGIARGTAAQMIPEIYPYTSYRRGEDAYPFSRKADIVVINLGTNDLALRTAASWNSFVEDAKAFVRTVREKQGDPTVIWVHNMMISGIGQKVETVMEELGGAQKGFYALELPREGESGSDGHPSLAQHKAAAEVLTEFINNL